MHLINALKASTILFGVFSLFAIFMAGVSLFQTADKNTNSRRRINQKELREDIEIGLARLQSWQPKIMWIILAATLSAVLALLSWFLFYNSDYSILADKWGTIGSYFSGILTPFLSFITIFMLLYTLVQQQKGLLLSHQELEDSRKEFKGTKEALEIQAQSALIQNFEYRLFLLIENIERTIQRFKITEISTVNEKRAIEVEISGSDVIPTLLKLTTKGCKSKSIEFPYNDLLSSVHKTLFTQSLMTDFEKHDDSRSTHILIKNEFPVCLTQLVVIAKFIKNSNFNQETKNNYYEMLSTRLNEFMIFIFFLHVVFNPEANNAVEGSDFFKRLHPTFPQNDKELFDLREFKLLVPTGIFGDNPSFKNVI
ncbi:hypothetical protein [Desulfoluna spongiiphila]|uniref:hypothetical protein n=1 Tax=Desulfoluna spongiiphila TaxID=419481 RepID=UPI0012522DC4|nr:hypothetical protein [Desulfoluna spongiiphila]VVS90795.1 hypothetical protein DBB_3630 [Desulfoluna spongiiphila]